MGFLGGRGGLKRSQMFRGDDVGAELGPSSRLPFAEVQRGREGAASRRGSRFSERGFPKFSLQVRRGVCVC